MFFGTDLSDPWWLPMGEKKWWCCLESSALHVRPHLLVVTREPEAFQASYIRSSFPKYNLNNISSYSDTEENETENDKRDLTYRVHTDSDKWISKTKLPNIDVSCVVLKRILSKNTSACKRNRAESVGPHSSISAYSFLTFLRNWRHRNESTSDSQSTQTTEFDRIDRTLADLSTNLTSS